MFGLALEESLDLKNVVSALKSLQKAYEKAYISMQACYGLFQKSRSEILDLTQFGQYRKAKFFDESKIVIEEFGAGMRNFAQKK